MSTEAQALVLFCDDVRVEEGGKVSYMGVLGPEVWIAPGRNYEVYAVLLLWAFESSVAITAEFDFENAPEGILPADPFRSVMKKHEDDDADRWLIQLSGRLEIRLENEPFVVTAKFTVGDATYSGRVVFEASPEDGAKVIEGLAN